jgi:hypothetical protein
MGQTSWADLAAWLTDRTRCGRGRGADNGSSPRAAARTPRSREAPGRDEEAPSLTQRGERVDGVGVDYDPVAVDVRQRAAPPLTLVEPGGALLAVLGDELHPTDPGKGDRAEKRRHQRTADTASAPGLRHDDALQHGDGPRGRGGHHRTATRQSAHVAARSRCDEVTQRSTRATSAGIGQEEEDRPGPVRPQPQAGRRVAAMGVLLTARITRSQGLQPTAPHPWHLLPTRPTPAREPPRRDPSRLPEDPLLTTNTPPGATTPGPLDTEEPEMSAAVEIRTRRHGTVRRYGVGYGVEDSDRTQRGAAVALAVRSIGRRFLLLSSQRGLRVMT